MNKRVLTLILFISGIIFLIPFLVGMTGNVVGATGNVIGINTTTKVFGIAGLGFVILAAIIENLEEEKLHKKPLKKKSH